MPSPELRHDSLSLALHAAVRTHAREIGTQLGRASKGHHAGIHRARKALVRLRALLALSRAAPQPATHLESRARAVAHSLSRLRDAQAAHETALDLARSKAAADQHDAWRAAIGGLEVNRDRLLQAKLRTDPRLSALRKRFAVLRVALEAYDWSVVKPENIKAALHHSARRVKRARKHARACSSQETRHRVRRRMRRLLQQLALLQAIADDKKHTHAAKQAGKLIARESKHHHVRKRLVDALGDERDLYLLRETLKRRRVAGADTVLTFVDDRLTKAVATSNELIT